MFKVNTTLLSLLFIFSPVKTQKMSTRQNKEFVEKLERNATYKMEDGKFLAKYGSIASGTAFVCSYAFAYLCEGDLQRLAYPFTLFLLGSVATTVWGGAKYINGRRLKYLAEVHRSKQDDSEYLERHNKKTQTDY